jgi:hypothetical protein
MAHTACLVCFISTVNGRSKKIKKKPWKTGASSGHITNLKQSILETFDIYVQYLYHELHSLLYIQQCLGYMLHCIKYALQCPNNVYCLQFVLYCISQTLQRLYTLSCSVLVYSVSIDVSDCRLIFQCSY